MGLNVDDEILQDFLVEAGELLDGLNEQLVELERNPSDQELLNAVFRGFHTIKGGAGFLELNSLVTVCHRAEDVFNLLRQGQRQVDGTLMDAVLQVLDVVTRMFDEIRSGQLPAPADAQLLSVLETLADPNGIPEPGLMAGTRDPAGVPAAPADGDAVRAEATEPGTADAVDADGATPAAEPASAEEPSDEPDRETGEISDEEFEQLLDSMHGKGKGPSNEDAAPPAAERVPAAPPVTSAESPSGSVASQAAATESRGGSKPTATETSVRVDTGRLDDIMNLVGELVLVRNRLANLRANANDEELSKAVGNLDVVTADLQTAVMKTRMQPIKKVFGRFPRVVRDLARSIHKEINLEMQGEDTDLDKNLVEALADPLVHLVRNAVDHGIESPDERERLGKPRAGHVVLAAAQEGDHILLTITDDGRGMDPEVFRRKVVDKGLMDAEAAARMSDRDALNLIFMAGFSTKSEISDISGRGVGMDVVKTRIAQLNGTVEIDSKPGHGSILRITVPLTLAIMPTLMVVVGRQRFALPLASVSEIFDLDLSGTHRVDDQEVVMVREHALPIHRLSEWLEIDPPSATLSDKQHVVVVFIGSQTVGLVVDRLIGQEEVVIKPLGSYLQGLTGFAGATITGDGGIALILDVPGLLRAHARTAALSG